jgi:hypothetical protein
VSTNPRHGFDRVTIPGPNPDAPRRSLSRADYERLPLRDRVHFLMEGSVKFFRDGEEVSARDALKG